MNVIKKLFISSPLWVASIVWGTGIQLAFAQATNQVPAPITTEDSLKLFLCGIIAWFFWIIIVISVIMVMVAAFDYITAGDDTEKTSRGRKRLTYAAIGIAIAILAAGFPDIISTVFPNGGAGVSLNDTCTAIGI